MMRRRALWLAAPAAVLSACSLVTDLSELGADGSAPDSAPTESGGDETTPEASCGAGSACVPAPPSGWNGPFWIYYGDPASRPASCPSSAPVETVSGNDQLLDASVTCGARVCAPQCGLLVPTIVGCGGTFTSVSPVGPNCYRVAATLGSSWSTELTSTTTSCAYTAPALDASVVFQAAMLGCASDASTPVGCAASELCMPSAPLPFEGKACVFRTGSSECPGAPYSQLRSSTLFEGITPHCDVTQCACSTTAAACSVAIDYLGPDASCGPPNTTIDAGTCISDTSPMYVHGVATPPANPTCSLPDGSPPCKITGGVTPIEPFTVCCVP